MMATADNLLHKQRKLGRFVAAVGAWFQSLDYTSFDYTQDRIDVLEQKVAALTEGLRANHVSSPRDSAPR